MRKEKYVGAHCECTIDRPPDTSVCTHLETTIDQETYYRTKRHAISLCQLPVHVCTSVCMCIQAGIASRQCTSRYLPHIAHFERDKHCVCEERERERFTYTSLSPPTPMGARTLSLPDVASMISRPSQTYLPLWRHEHNTQSAIRSCLSLYRPGNKVVEIKTKPGHPR